MKGNNRVALMQLASSAVTLLIQTRRMWRLPRVLEDFLRDPSHVMVGFSWEGGDEQKLQLSFGLGRAAMPHFIDLQQVGSTLGYHDMGLAALAQRVLGITPPKSRSVRPRNPAPKHTLMLLQTALHIGSWLQVTMSNWEAARLSGKQLTYAALDAMLAGGIFRALRAWHLDPCGCGGCGLPLGQAVLPCLVCSGCHRRFSGVASLSSHAISTQHCAPLQRCETCGRMTA